MSAVIIVIILFFVAFLISFDWELGKPNNKLRNTIISLTFFISILISYHFGVFSTNEHIKLKYIRYINSGLRTLNNHVERKEYIQLSNKIKRLHDDFVYTFDGDKDFGELISYINSPSCLSEEESKEEKLLQIAANQSMDLTGNLGGTNEDYNGKNN